MKELKIGRITLSFIFISLGIILLLEKILNHRIVDMISTFWPIIVVFFGLEIIYTYFYIKNDKQTDKKIDILSLSIISTFVLILGTNNITKMNTPYRYSENISEEIKLEMIKKIIIKDSNIDIMIKQSENKHSKIKLEGIYKHNKRKDLKNKTNFIKQDSKDQTISITRDDDIINRNIKKTIKKDMKYLIEIPRGVEIELVSSYGDIDIDDINNNINIVNSFGDIKLEDIVGNVNIENSYGDFEGADIKGILFIKSNNGNIAIESSQERQDNMDVYCDFGDVKMVFPRQQKGKFNIITTYGHIHDELKFDIIESASTKAINQTRKNIKPNFNIRVNNGDIILKEE